MSERNRSTRRTKQSRSSSPRRCKAISRSPSGARSLRGMKRGADREMGSPLKRPRNLGHELRILIPSRNAGSIIGKGGSNITRLRNENKATISVPDCPGPERLITIAADEQETTFNVLSEIVPLLEDTLEDNLDATFIFDQQDFLFRKSKIRVGASGTMAGNKERGRGGSESAVATEVRVLFHHTQVGCIIGKGGGKIKELRESSGAQIKVYGSCCPRSTDRVVAVSGSTDVVLNAVKQVVALASDSPIKGMSEQYDPHNYDELYAAQYGGFGEPRGGGYAGDRYRSMGGGGGARMVGPPRGAPRYRNGGSSSSREGRSAGGGRNRSGGSGSRSNGVSRDGYDDYGDERTTNQVTIPKEYAGAIIGKGGSRIRRIRAESGASITIDEALPGATDRIITISGALGQIRMAQYLLQQSVKDHGGKADKLTSTISSSTS